MIIADTPMNCFLSARADFISFVGIRSPSSSIGTTCPKHLDPRAVHACRSVHLSGDAIAVRIFVHSDDSHELQLG